MIDDTENKLDEMLADLAREERDAQPALRDALIARVLTGAAELGAIRSGHARTPGDGRQGLFEQWFGSLAGIIGRGWAPGAAVAMLGGLVLGFAFGLEGNYGVLDETPLTASQDVIVADAGMFVGDAPF